MSNDAPKTGLHGLPEFRDTQGEQEIRELLQELLEDLEAGRLLSLAIAAEYPRSMYVTWRGTERMSSSRLLGGLKLVQDELSDGLRY